MVDFSHPVGGLGLFVQDGDSATGVLRLIHGMQSYPGAPGRSRDRMWTFVFEDTWTVLMWLPLHSTSHDNLQLVIKRDTIVPGTVKRVQQLIPEEPTDTTLGPFTVDDANVRTMKTLAMAYFSFELMELLLGSNLNVRQVYELVVPTLIESGSEETCSVLIVFLLLLWWPLHPLYPLL
jgi:hypothetical protein